MDKDKAAKLTTAKGMYSQVQEMYFSPTPEAALAMATTELILCGLLILERAMPHILAALEKEPK